jgi:GNAT superfamily N-acetyltransferase
MWSFYCRYLKHVVPRLGGIFTPTTDSGAMLRLRSRVIAGRLDRPATFPNHMIATDTVIRTLAPAEWAAYRELRLRALADSPDAYGSTLAAEQDRPAQAWAERLALAATSGRDYPLVAEAGGALVGLAWAKRSADEPDVIDIFQMWVAPTHRGQGIAAALVREAVAWARAAGARSARLGVETGNGAAVRLYAREGFVNAGEPVPMRPGSHLMEHSMLLALVQD